MYPQAYPHDPIKQLYPGVYLLHGSIRMGPGMRLNRNMLILQQDEDLTLINPVRMNEEGLAQLDAMGKVKNIIRLGDFHGLDDEFYLDRYQGEFWCQPGQDSYPQPKASVVIQSDTSGPVADSEFFIFRTALYPEAALLLKQHKLLITTDAVQYYSGWSYTSAFTKFAFKLLGFKFGINIGPPWLKRVTPKGGSLKGDFEQLLQLDFDALVAAHGSLIDTGAKQLLQQEVKQKLG